MRVTILKGEFEGKTAEVISQTMTKQHRLCGGPSSEHSYTALIDGMLYPVELSPSEVGII